MNQRFHSQPSDEKGASAVEYALLASLIAAVIVLTVAATGTKVFGLYDDSCRDIAGAIDGSFC